VSTVVQCCMLPPEVHIRGFPRWSLSPLSAGHNFSPKLPPSSPKVRPASLHRFRNVGENVLHLLEAQVSELGLPEDARARGRPASSSETFFRWSSMDVTCYKMTTLSSTTHSKHGARSNIFINVTCNYVYRQHYLFRLRCRFLYSR